MNSHSDAVRTRDGMSLSLRHWPASDQTEPRGTSLLVHGLGEHIGRYERLAGKLCESGWSVVGYDQRGHGLSDGARGVLSQSDDLLHDLASVLDTIGQIRSNQKLVLLGHSQGGLVVGRLACFMIEAAETVKNRSALWKTPTLLLYSGDDRCVCPIGSADFSSEAPEPLVESHVYEQLRHEILNEPEEAGVYSSLLDWLEKFA